MIAAIVVRYRPRLGFVSWRPCATFLLATLVRSRRRRCRRRDLSGRLPNVDGIEDHGGNDAAHQAKENAVSPDSSTIDQPDANINNYLAAINDLAFFLSWSPSASQIIGGVFVDANIMIIH